MTRAQAVLDPGADTLSSQRYGSAATNVTSPWGDAAAHRPAGREPATAGQELVVDLLPAIPEPPPEMRPAGAEDYGLGRNWGATWRWTAQGWVDRDSDHPTWRPVVTTTDVVSNWEPDTYLGVVSGEAAVRAVQDTATLGAALSAGREAAVRGMVDAGVARGAHAVIGADLTYTELGDHIIVTSTGTAVTLRER